MAFTPRGGPRGGGPRGGGSRGGFSRGGGAPRGGGKFFLSPLLRQYHGTCVQSDLLYRLLQLLLVNYII